jgi:hypothetical protein
MTTTAEEVGTGIGFSLDAQTRGEIDIQIATAKRFPRSVKKFIDDVLAMATLTEETAAACFYSKPQGGDIVTGPSARLAEMVASCWGNVAIEGKPVHDDGRFVTSRGVAWDLQNNVRVAFEAKRRVTNRQGVRYSDDMVMTTTNAATSIAMRNAIFKVVPRAFWGPIEEKCREVARGKADTLVNTRTRMLKHYATLGVTSERVFARLEVRGIEDVTLEHVELLRGLATGIKEGDTSIDEAFPLAQQPASGAAGEPPKSTLDRLADAMAEGPTAVSDMAAKARAAVTGQTAAEVSRAAGRKQQQDAHEVPRARRDREPGEDDQ